MREQVPATAEGMARGEVHLSQAEVIVESMKDLSVTVLPAQRAHGEQTLLDACATLDPAGLGQLGRRLEELLDPEGVQARDEAKIRDHEAKAFRGRELTLSPDPYGSGGLIRGRYDAAGYAVIAAALDALSCPWSEGAAASGEVGIAGFGESIDQRAPAQRRYDALVEVCRRHLHSTATTSGDGGKAQIRVTIPLATLVDGVGYGLLDDGLAISPTMARMLACDAALIPAVLNGNGAPIDLGRERRLYTGAARTAIEIRDGGCVWPGCARPPSWTQVHHLLAWSSGGRTDQRNGGLFCWHHHREIESSEWEAFYHRGRIWLQPPTRIDLRRRPRINLTHRPIPPHRDWPSGASGGPAP